MRAIKKIWPIVTTEKTVSIKFILFIIGSLLTLIIVTFLFGPYSYRHETCLFCGMSKDTRKHCGVTISQKEKHTPISEWVLSLYPEHKKHIYTFGSGSSRSKWFGYDVAADGGLSLVWIYHLHQFGKEEEAHKWLKKWHEILKLPEKEQYDAFIKIIDTLRPIVDDAFEEWQKK